MKHCTINATDGVTALPICTMDYERLMLLIVWHRMHGDRGVFDKIYEFAKRANESELGHECQNCGAQLVMLSNDSEFAELKRYSDQMKIEEIVK